MKAVLSALHGSTSAACLLSATIGSAAAGTPRWTLEDAPKIGDAVYALGQVGFDSFEISGVVLSRTWSNRFWGVEDAGSNVVFAFDAAGQWVQTVAVQGLASEDLEDISADNEGNLYLADTGTNLHARDEVFVHRINEPGSDDTSVPLQQSWRLKWPEAGRDCESMVVHDGYVWLVAKIRATGQLSTLARFALADTNEVITLEVVGDLDVPTPAAAADLLPDGSVFAVSTRAGTYSWPVNGNVASAVGRPPVFSASTPDTKNEGLTCVPQGLLVATESRDLYLDVTPGVIPTPLTPGLDVVRGSRGVQLFWTASYGVDCALEYRERLDQEWSTVAAGFPGLGFRTEWRRSLPNAGNGGFFRLKTSP